MRIAKLNNQQPTFRAEISTENAPDKLFPRDQHMTDFQKYFDLAMEPLKYSEGQVKITERKPTSKGLRVHVESAIPRGAVTLVKKNVVVLPNKLGPVGGALKLAGVIFNHFNSAWMKF